MGNLWSRGVARSSIMGYEKTSNPTPAAVSMLGKRRVKAAQRKLKKRGIKRRHKGNPLPAVVGLLGGALGGVSKRFRAPSEVRAARLAPSIIQAANAGNLTAARGLIERAARPMKVAESNVWKAAAAQLSADIVKQVSINSKSIPMADQSDPEHFAASVAASPFQASGSGPAASGIATALNVLSAPGTVRAIASVARGGSRRRQRYPTYIDRYGRQRYSTKPPGGELRLPAGATPAPGTPYSFFQGAVGKGGAAATAGQLAVAAGAGIAAYLVTQRVLAALGGKAQRAEEAGVNATLALRQARADLERQQGHKATPAQVREMSAAWKQQLVQLGYDPVTFTRKRSGVESFLEDYNPLGG